MQLRQNSGRHADMRGACWSRLCTGTDSPQIMLERAKILMDRGHKQFHFLDRILEVAPDDAKVFTGALHMRALISRKKLWPIMLPV